jgi:hypothetical protein
MQMLVNTSDQFMVLRSMRDARIQFFFTEQKTCGPGKRPPTLMLWVKSDDQTSVAASGNRGYRDRSWDECSGDRLKEPLSSNEYHQ